MGGVELAAGHLIAGRYRLIALIGRGGMGEVWRGRDIVLDRDVAVKLVRLRPEDDPARRRMLTARALREARSAARLNHPGIVVVHDVVEQGGFPVIVMELLPGVSLGELSRSRGGIGGQEAAWIGISILRALEAAHRAHIIHRDLKPSNVLLAGDRVVITDFGIAHVPDGAELTLTGELVGTPAFMSPEQARGDVVTTASDVYSVGATLYAAVEGNPPFTGTGPVAVLAALLSQEPPPMKQGGPLEAVLRSMMAKNPAARPTAAEAARALAETGAMPFQSPVPGTDAQFPTPTPALTGRPPSRRRVLALVGLAGLTLGGGASAAAFLLSGGRKGGVPPVLTSPLLLAGHRDAVGAVAFDPTGPLVATGSSDSEVRLWDTATRQTVHVFRNPKPGKKWIPVRALAWRPDGQMLLSSGDDPVLRFWDVRARDLDREMKVEAPGLTGLDFNREGTLLGTSDGEGVHIWNALDLTETARIRHGTQLLRGVVFSPDSRMVATSSDDKAIRLWDLASRSETRQLIGHYNRIRGMHFSPDGRRLLSVGVERNARLWDVATGAFIGYLIGHRDEIIAIAYSHDGRHVATGGKDDEIRVWDAETRKTVMILAAGAQTYALEFSADDERLMSGHQDQQARIWDISQL